MRRGWNGLTALAQEEAETQSLRGAKRKRRIAELSAGHSPPRRRTFTRPGLVGLETKRVAFLATEEEHAMLQALADSEYVTVSGWLRKTLRAAYARMTAKRAKAAVKRRTR